MGEQKLLRVVDKPAHPPLARQRSQRIIKCATVKHEMVSVKINAETGFVKTVATNELIKRFTHQNRNMSVIKRML